MVPTAQQKVDPQYWLLKILCAAVRKAGGELRIDDDTLAGVPAGASVITEHDSAQGEWVIRYAAETPQMFVVGTSPTDPSAWLKDPNTRPALNPSLTRSIRREDADVAELEQRWKLQAQARELEQL